MRDARIILTLSSPTDRIPVRSFVGATQTLWRILVEVERNATGRAATTWAIRNLRMGSPASVEIGPLTEQKGAQPHQSISLTVAGLGLLERKKQRPKHFSEKALKLARELVGVVDSVNIDDITVNNGHKSVVISQKLVENVTPMVAGKSQKSIGSVDGRLDLINVHSGLQVGVFRLIDDKQVRAIIDQDSEAMLTKIKELLGKRVYVTGEVKRNPAGDPVAIVVKDIQPVLDDHELPSLDDVYGLDPDFTGGLSVEEFLRRQRGE